MKLATSSPAATPAATVAVTAAATVAVTVAVTAHRGDSSRHRENTSRAIGSALAAGAPTVEIDVRVTSDGEVILLHDETLERLWGDPRPASSVTWSEIQDLGGGAHRIPRLADVLRLFDESPALLLIDMDSAEPAAAAQRVVAAHPGTARVAWCGALEAMRLIRRLDGAAEIWMPWSAAEAPSPHELAELRPRVLNLNHLVVSAALVEAVHAFGIQVSCWTVDDLVQARHLARIGVDSITTNELPALLGEFGPAADASVRADRDEVPDCETGHERRHRARLVARTLAEWATEFVHTHRVGEIDTKANPADHVTEIDREIERGVRQVIAAQFPDHVFVGEEFGGTAAPGRPCWYLDPVDGTANLANGVPWTSFSLALVEDRAPVVGVVADPWRNVIIEAAAGEGAWANGVRLELAAATGDHATDPLRGAVVSTELAGHRPWPGMRDLVDGLADRYCTTRVMGSGTLTLAGVALGHGCGAVIGAFGAVDHLAAALIVREAGGVVLDERGNDTLFPPFGGVLAARDRRTAEALFALWRNGVACDATRSAARDA